MYSFLLRNIIVPLGDLLFGGGYIASLKEWNEYDTFSEERLLQIQQDRLEETLKYTIDRVPFYRNLKYDDSLSPYDNLKHFPILTKDTLREHAGQLISDDFDEKNLRKNYSSGSSGIQSYSFSEKKNVFYIQGLSNHWYMWGGFQMGDRVLQFGISPQRTLPKRLKDIFFRVSYEDAFTLDNDDYERIYKNMRKSNIQFIIGYPSAVNQLAEYFIQNNLNHSIKTIISLGDKLFDHFEENFDKAFGNPEVIDTYGCAEGFLIACRHDTPYYYISAPHVYIEVVDDQDNEVADGELGHVLLTCFTNLAQPFVRYKLGDLAIKLPRNEYPENRKFNYPLLKRIVGRETDIVKTPNGKTLIVHSFTGIIEYYPDIKQYQIIQNTLDEITIKYIVDHVIPLEKTTLSNIEEEINKMTDSSLKIVFEKTDFIPNAPSGKPQIIKSTLI